MKALYIPSSSYHDMHAKTYAGWVKILEYQEAAIRQAGFDVTVVEVPENYIDDASSFSQIASYSLYVGIFSMMNKFDLIIGSPSYAHHAFFLNNNLPKRIGVVWNQADWFRDKQLQEEFERNDSDYPTLPINNLMNEVSLSLCDRVIANSHFVKKTHAELVPEEKISIAPWGVDSEMFFPATEKPPGLRVLFFGSNPIRKGLTYADRAVIDAGEAVSEFWVLGCSPEKLDVPENSKVRVLGMVPHAEVPEIIRQCHVLLLPTLEDGMPLAVQEAMACGVVPITTEVGAEAFDDCRSGFVVPYRDPGAITKCLKLLHDSPDLLNTMSREARRKAETQTWVKFVNAFASIIEEVMHDIP